MRLKAFLIVILAVAGLVIAGQTSPAYAASCVKARGSASVHAFEPYASTGYGPVTHGIQVLGNKARAGFYSGITNNFSPTTDFVELTALRAWVNSSNSSDNSGRYLTCVWGTLDTPYGPVGYGSQYRQINNRDSNPQVRWGNYNFATQLFYPDSDGWRPIA